jgi:hypothetical protein
MAPRTVRGGRGFEEGFWGAFDDLVAIARSVGLTNTMVPRRLLYAGPCPGLWRIFYTLKHAAEQDQEIAPADYLGRPTLAQSKRALGAEVERWVSQANKIYNGFLRSSHPDIRILDRIETPALRAYYLDRATRQLEDGHPQGFLGDCTMDVDPTLEVFPQLPLTKSRPDGVFLSVDPGAIFESKLSQPAYDTFDREMAAYAIVAEKASGDKRIPVDLAIILHCGYPGQAPGILPARITDSAVQGVLKNVSLFRDLVLYSLASRVSAITAEEKPTSWLDLLVRPPGAPAPDKRGPCGGCRHRGLCWSEGGIEGGVP